MIVRAMVSYSDWWFRVSKWQGREVIRKSICEKNCAVFASLPLIVFGSRYCIASWRGNLLECGVIKCALSSEEIFNRFIFTSTQFSVKSALRGYGRRFECFLESLLKHFYDLFFRRLQARVDLLRKYVETAWESTSSAITIGIEKNYFFMVIEAYFVMKDKL